MRVVRNPDVLWRRTASSVVVLPLGGEPTELIGAAAAVWDAVAQAAPVAAVETIDPREVELIVDALVELDLVVPT
jgi:hypothetical protein